MQTDARSWSEQTFGQVALGDRRRTAQAVTIAARMAERPSASLPGQMQTWAATKAAYRWLDNDQISHAKLMAPHWQQTRKAASAGGVTLLIQDTTDIDFTGRSVDGLGAIGDGRGWGFRLHNTLAVRPESGEVLGLAYQQPYLRQALPVQRQSSAQRAKRARESQRWEQAVAAIGPAPADQTWVYVCDREGDIFSLFQTCRANDSHFLVRVQTERRVSVNADEAEVMTHLRTVAGGIEGQFTKTVQVTQTNKRQREATVTVGWAQLKLQAPFHSRLQPAIDAWLVRAVEVSAPPEGEEAVDWLLLTSVPTDTPAAAAERLNWYECRWLVEDYHQCLKTGCRLEQRQLETKDRLWRLLGLLGVVAVRLLQLRQWARQTPDQPARHRLPAELVALVAHLGGQPAAALTLAAFWRTVAQQGGYLGRRRDGPPGWKTLWRGWERVQTLLEGARLAADLLPLVQPSRACED